jgi:hypothetical protein
LRAKLANAVAACPGVGGTKWNCAIEEHRDSLQKKFASDTNLLQKMLKQSDEDLVKWITVERFNPLAGAPGNELASTCAAIIRWAMTRAADENSVPALAEQYAYLASHASDLAAILRSLSLVTRAQLDRLHDHVSVPVSIAIIPLQKLDTSTDSLRQELSWNQPMRCCGGISGDSAPPRERRGQARKSNSSEMLESSSCPQ